MSANLVNGPLTISGPNRPDPLTTGRKREQDCDESPTSLIRARLAAK